MELRKAEASADEWRARALAGEEREESLSGRIAEYERIAGGGTHELRMKLDSMEGRVLAAEAFTAWLETVAPLTVATWRETWHRSLEIASRSVGTPSLTEHDASTVSQEKK
jgi:hypothetical protein